MGGKKGVSGNPKGRPASKNKRVTFSVSRKDLSEMLNMGLLQVVIPEEDKGTQYVYCVKDEDRGLFKIGKTINPFARMKQLLRSSGEGVDRTIVFVNPCEDADLAELDLHTIMQEKHVHGEWFKLEGSDILRCLAVLNNTANRVRG